MKSRIKQLVEAIEASIAHWKHMVEWVREQDPIAGVDDETMQAELGEFWFGDFCPLCDVCSCHSECTDCPLLACGYGCNDEASPWDAVHRSDTWGQWLDASETLMLPALNKTLEIYQKKLKGKSHAHAKSR